MREITERNFPPLPEKSRAEPTATPAAVAAPAAAATTGTAEAVDPDPCQDICDWQESRGAAQLAKHGGIPRGLARELGMAGSSALEAYLKKYGGVGLPPDPNPQGLVFALCPSGTDYALLPTKGMIPDTVSLTWEQGLRLKLPELLEEQAELNVRLTAQVAALQTAVDGLLKQHEASQQRANVMIARIEQLWQANIELGGEE